MLNITLNERTTGTFNEYGLINLSLSDFKAFYKKWIIPAREPEAAADQLREALKKTVVKDRQKKLIVLSGEKSKKTDVSKALTFLSKADRVVIQFVNEKAYITDSHCMIECKKDDFMESAKTNVILKELAIYAEKETAAECRRYGKSVNTYGSKMNLENLFERIENEALTAGIKKDFGASRIFTHVNYKAITDLYMVDGIAIKKKYTDLFTNKDYYCINEKKPVYSDRQSYKAVIMPFNYWSDGELQ